MEILNNIGTIIGIIGTMYSIGTWLYYNKIKFYLFFNKLLSNRREVSFEMSLSFRYVDKLDFNAIDDLIKELYGSDIKKVTNLKNSKIYNLKKFLFEIKQVDSLDENDKNVSLKLINVNVTYKTAVSILEQAGKIMTRTSEQLHVEDKYYHFKVNYYESNPFLGVNLNRMGTKSIKSFICTLDFNELFSKKEDDLNNKHIQITKNSVDINDDNFNDLRRMAQVFLTI